MKNKMLNFQPMRILTLIAMLFLVVSCTSQEPLLIVITPTHEPTASPTVTLVPPSQEINPTDTIVPPSVTPTQAGDGRYFGPIIGADYTPPPTTTPRLPASETSQPIATAIPATPTTQFSNLPTLNPDLMGVQLYYNVPVDPWWELLQQTRPLGVRWVKLQANWDFLQPNSADQFDMTFGLFEANVQRAHNEGFAVLVSIAKAPDWARGGVTDHDGPPVDPQLLANFITLMLSRFGQQISAIEIWNEPNLIREWNGNLPFTGEGYMQLFRPAYDAVRAYSPNIGVITAGLAPTGTNVELGSVDDRLFLQQMYNAGLSDPYYSNIAIGMHPYGWGNAPDARCCDNVQGQGWDDDPHFYFLNTIEDYRAIMEQNDDADRQMWTTEFGWATWEGIPSEAPEPWMTYNTAQQQADYTMRAFQIGQSRPYMGPMFLWNLNFANQTLLEQRNEMVGYSLFIPGLDIRPLYHALASRPR